jgi:hypothetical protein
MSTVSANSQFCWHISAERTAEKHIVNARAGKNIVPFSTLESFENEDADV